jgi:hypothetical protein
LGVLTGVGIYALPAQAFQIFFGEDLGQGESIRLPSTPNANAAQSQFLSKLKNVGTEDFEGQTNGQTTPLTVPNIINGPGGGVLFYGVISENENELFDEVVFGNTASGVDFFGFDDMTVGDLAQVEVVPEPLTILGSATALGFGAFFKRKLKSSKSLEKVS